VFRVTLWGGKTIERRSSLLVCEFKFNILPIRFEKEFSFVKLIQTKMKIENEVREKTYFQKGGLK
jgi:hypothetical protein